jgi:hypothetical protein
VLTIVVGLIEKEMRQIRHKAGQDKCVEAKLLARTETLQQAKSHQSVTDEGTSGGLWVSHNYGDSFVDVSSVPSSVKYVATSGNGELMVFIDANYGGLWLSSDYGHCFAPITPPTKEYLLASCRGLAVSSSGEQIMAYYYNVVYAGNVMKIYSNDFGVSWDFLMMDNLKDSSTQNMSFIISNCNGNGEHMACSGWPYLKISHDSGINFDNKYNKELPTGQPKSMCFSSSGEHLVIVNSDFSIWVSHDYGDSWEVVLSVPNFLHWRAVCSSANGSQVVAVVEYGSGIWKSDDYGHTWANVYM